MRIRISATVAAIFFALFSPVALPRAQAAVAAGVGVVQSNLLMAFDLANPSGLSGSTLTDLSGNGYNGTIYQTSSQPSLNTSQGNFLSFNGNSGYVDIGKDIVSGSNWTGLSISFYANMGTRTVVERILDFGIGQANNNIWVGMGNVNRMAIEVFRDGGSPGWCESADNSVGANEWAQWTVVLDGTNCAWYKNNVLSRSVAYANLPWARTLTTNYIGDSNWAVDPSFEGGIGELAVYKSTLNSSERTQNYNAQTDLTPPTLTSPASPYTYSVAENTTAVGTLVAATAAYFTPISGPDFAKFSMVGGALSFVDPPNYEAPTDTSPFNSYSLNVRIMDANGNYADWVIYVNVTNVVETSSISAPTLSATPNKGVPVTITATPSAEGSAGKVTFYSAGKRIPGCINKTYVGSGNATCTWKPNVSGYKDIKVTFLASAGGVPMAQASKNVFVLNRSTRR